MSKEHENFEVEQTCTDVNIYGYIYWENGFCLDLKTIKMSLVEFKDNTLYIHSKDDYDIILRVITLVK